MLLNRNNLIILASILLALSAVVWLFSNIIIYIVISLVIATILRPITDYVDNIEFLGIKTPRVFAVLFSFVVLAGVISSFVLLFVPLIVEQIKILQKIDYIQLVERLSEPIELIEGLIMRNFPSPDRESGFLLEDISEILLKFIETLQIAPILNYIFSFAGTIFIYFLAITFITFFFLYEKGLMRRGISRLIPNAYFEVVITAIYKIERLLSNYLLGLLIQITIMFSIIALGLSIVPVKYALTIAAFAAVINLIPYLGPVLGYIFAIFVIFSTNEFPEIKTYLFLALKASPVFAIAQLTDNLVLQPLIFSKSVKAHPLEIFIAIFAGAAVAGGLGMIAAIPVYTILRVALIELRTGYQQYHIFKTKRS